MNATPLPDNPSRLTFHGRYDHIDWALVQLLAARLPANSRVTMLDVGAGVLPNGASPTASDSYQVLREAHYRPVITAVDEQLPTNCPDLYCYSDIHYSRTPNQVRGTFDIVRCLHVIEHLGEQEYVALRNKLVRWVNLGGFLVVTQEIGYWKMASGGPELRLLNPVVKIMRRGWLTVKPIALLPDRLISHLTPLPMFGDTGNAQALRDYTVIRNQVASGELALDKGLDWEGYQRCLRELASYSPAALEHESIDALYRNGALRSRPKHEKKYPLLIMNRNGILTPCMI